MSESKQYGKGSKRRQENFKKVQDNWDLINWSKKPNVKKKEPKCDCEWHEKQVCDICQRPIGKDKV
jgi:hypothetical protein